MGCLAEHRAARTAGDHGAKAGHPQTASSSAKVPAVPPFPLKIHAQSPDRPAPQLTLGIRKLPLHRAGLALVPARHRPRETAGQLQGRSAPVRWAVQDCQARMPSLVPEALR